MFFVICVGENDSIVSVTMKDVRVHVVTSTSSTLTSKSAITSRSGILQHWNQQFFYESVRWCSSHYSTQKKISIANDLQVYDSTRTVANHMKLKWKTNWSTIVGCFLLSSSFFSQTLPVLYSTFYFNKIYLDIW